MESCSGVRDLSPSSLMKMLSRNLAGASKAKEIESDFPAQAQGRAARWARAHTGARGAGRRALLRCVIAGECDTPIFEQI